MNLEGRSIEIDYVGLEYVGPFSSRYERFREIPHFTVRVSYRLIAFGIYVNYGEKQVGKTAARDIDLKVNEHQRFIISVQLK